MLPLGEPDAPLRVRRSSLDSNAKFIYTGARVNLISIVRLAVRRKGIARFAALHLDCARSAEERVFIGSRRKSNLLYCSAYQRASEIRRNSWAILALAFEFFARHWSACPSFNEMIQQDLPRASFAPIS